MPLPTKNRVDALLGLGAPPVFAPNSTTAFTNTGPGIFDTGLAFAKSAVSKGLENASDPYGSRKYVEQELTKEFVKDPIAFKASHGGSTDIPKLAADSLYAKFDPLGAVGALEEVGPLTSRIINRAIEAGATNPKTFERITRAGEQAFRPLVEEGANAAGRLVNRVSELLDNPTPRDPSSPLPVPKPASALPETARMTSKDFGAERVIKPESVPSTELDPLAQEARKYKSAAEFVKGQPTLYHGNSTEGAFKLGDQPTFLTTDKVQADKFANDVMYGQQRGGLGRVLEFAAKPGKSKTITIPDNIGYGIDDFVKKQATIAKNEGYRYLEFEHPVVDTDLGKFPVKVSLFPKEDLLTKSQLTDIWNKANPAPATDFSQTHPFLDMSDAERADALAKLDNTSGVFKPISKQEFAQGQRLVDRGPKELPTILSSPEATLNAEAAAPKRFKNFAPDLKTSFADWVNERRASKVEGYLLRKQYPDLEKQGIEGIMQFEEGKATGRLGEIRAYFDSKYKELKKAGVDIGYLGPGGARINYISHLWDNTPEEVQAVFRKSLTLKPSFTLDRVIDTYREGIAAGLKPKFNNVADLIGWYERYANKAIADRKFIDFLTAKGYVMPADMAPRSWKSLDPDHFPLNRAVVQTVDKTVEHTGVFKAPPELADVVNNYLRSNEDTPLRKAADYASRLKNIVLSSGIPKTGINAHGFNILARHALDQKNVLKIPGTGLAKGFFTGTNYLLRPGAAEKWLISQAERASFATRHGLTLSSEEHALEEISGNILKRGYGKLTQFQAKFFEEPLFEKVVPTIKLQHFDVVYHDLLPHMSSKEAATEAAKITNNLFGGINWEAFARHQQTQQILRSIILAPDWAESNVRLAGALTKSVTTGLRSAQFATYRRVMGNLLLAYFSMNVTNKLTSGHWMWENEPGHTFEIELGKESQGRRRYLRPLGTAADFVRIPYDVALSVAKGDLSSVFRVIRNRLSLPLGTAAGLVTNTDYLGRPILGKDKYGREIPVWQQAGGLAGEASNLALPQYVQAGVDLATGRSSPEQAASQAIEAPLRYGSKPPKKKARHIF